MNKGAKGDKGDMPSFTINGDTIEDGDVVTISGVENASVRIVTNQTELTTAISGLEKELNIQSNIALSSNISLPDGAIISYGGGVIDVDTYDVTFVNNNLSNSKWDFSSGTINDASTFKDVEFVSPENYGAIGDYNTTTNTGTDNRNTLLQFQKIAHISGCDIRFIKEGYYGYEMVNARSSKDEPYNFYITGSTSLYFSKNTRLCAISNDLQDYDVLEIWKGKNSKVVGTGEFHLFGDLRTHDFTTNVNSWGCNGLKINNNSQNVLIDGVSSTEFSGDAGISRYNPEFVHFGTVVEAAFTKDNKIDETGAVVSDTDFAYSDRFAVTNSNFSDIGGFVFGGGSYAGQFGLDVQTYKVAFYDNTSIDGDTTTGFIALSDTVETYQKIPIPDTCTQIRLVINTPSVWGDLDGTIYAPTLSNSINVKNTTFSWGVRQGWSNLSPYSIFDNCTFINNGRRFDGTTGSPGFGFDSEDGYQNLHHVGIFNCLFKNNKGGDIILKGSRYFEIAFNRFLYNDVPEQVNVNSVSLANGYKTSFHDNVLQDRTLTLGRESAIFSNTLKDVTVEFNGENETFFGHKAATNVYFQESNDFLEDGVAYITDNSFIYDKPLNADNYVLTTIPNLIWENNVFDFGGLTHNSTTHRLSTNSSVAYLALGSMTNMVFKNILPETPLSDSMQLHAYNLDNIYSDTNLDIRNGGTVVDLFHKDITVKGWLNYELTSYPTTNGGDSSLYTTIINDGLDLQIPSIDYLGSTRYALYTENVDVNMVFKNGTIDLSLLVENSDGERFFNLDHYGTTIFENFTFITNKISATIDLNSLGSVDDVTLIDPVYANNISFTLRAGDKIRYTKPHPDLPVYADNAAAVADGYDVPGDMYKTATGDLKTVY